MNTAIECNNVGVALLSRGSLREALDTFKLAAQIMYPVSQYFQATNAAGATISPATTRPPPPNKDLNATVQEAKLKLMMAQDHEPEKGCNKKEDCFICTDPILLSRVEGYTESCTIESAIIVFNMGLTYHINGSLSCIQKALCLFDMSFSLAYSMNHLPLAPKIAMASLNNAGHIHHNLGSYQLSRQYLDTLSSYVLALPSTSSQEALRERHHFLLNAMLLNEPKIAGAA